MTSATSQEDKLKQTKPSALSKTRDWIGRNKNGILVNLVSAAIWTPAVWLLCLLRKAIVSVTVPPSTLLAALRSEIRVSAWILPGLFLLPLILLFMFWYVRLYVYCSDVFFGLRFTWLYSFPLGRVVRVRAKCPVCHAQAEEPTFPMMTDNYVCPVCRYDTHDKGRMDYPWHRAVARRVHERRNKYRDTNQDQK